MGGDNKELAEERIGRLAGRGLDVATFFEEAADAIVAAVPSSVAPSWTTLDPASLLITSSVCEGMAEITHEMLLVEYLEDDVMKAVDVARSERGIHTLLEATGGNPTRSRVYREYMQPRGIEHMVDVALRARSGDVWGTVSLAREPGLPEFNSDELDFLVAVAPYFAEGVRRGLLVGEATDAETPDAPGLVVLDRDWSVASLTPGVERWLSELPGGDFDGEGKLPTSVVAVAARALRTAEDEDAPGEVAVSRVLSRAGRWVMLHGAALVAEDARRVAVIVEPAGPARIIPLLMAAYGLTEREQDVTRLVLRGDSTTQIADTLFVSPHTVQEHLKSVFEKTGVRSRRELVGKVFFSHYEPRVRDNEQRVVVDKPIRGGPFPLQSDTPSRTT
jgi:DNA-binding CsgD family transcriptional regulator